jgi:ankyrin repeat protein
MISTIITEDFLEDVLDGNVDSVKNLVNKGALVNAEYSEGHTPLMYASFNGELDIVQVLTNSGVNVNSRDKNHTTSLMYAAGEGHSEIVKTLLKKGAFINARDKEGSTALMQAIFYNRLEVVVLLLKEGADITITDSKGDSASSLASKLADKSIFNVLERLEDRLRAIPKLKHMTADWCKVKLSSEPVSITELNSQTILSHLDYGRRLTDLSEDIVALISDAAPDTYENTSLSRNKINELVKEIKEQRAMKVRGKGSQVRA